jgi:hypothetical protein
MTFGLTALCSDWLVDGRGALLGELCSPFVYSGRFKASCICPLASVLQVPTGFAQAPPATQLPINLRGRAERAVALLFCLGQQAVNVDFAFRSHIHAAIGDSGNRETQRTPAVVPRVFLVAGV